MKRLGYVLAVAALMIASLLIRQPNAQARKRETTALSPTSRRLTVGNPGEESGALSRSDSGVSIQSTNLISIPFGFDTPLPVLDEGRDVIARGHGTCTDNEQVTIAITVTQSSSGAVATGEIVETCAGENQTWSARTTVDTSSLFVNDPGEACGLATTRDNGYVTDTFDWCKDVDLIRLDESVYLPVSLSY